MSLASGRWAELRLRSLQAATFGVLTAVGLWASIGLFALVGILRPEAAHWLNVSGSLYTLGGIALVAGLFLPTGAAAKHRVRSLMLLVLGVWLVLTAVQFVAFLGRPGSSAGLFAWNFLRWGSALALACWAAAWGATTAVERAREGLAVDPSPSGLR